MHCAPHFWFYKKKWSCSSLTGWPSWTARWWCPDSDGPYVYLTFGKHSRHSKDESDWWLHQRYHCGSVRVYRNYSKIKHQVLIIRKQNRWSVVCFRDIVFFNARLGLDWGFIHSNNGKEKMYIIKLMINCVEQVVALETIGIFDPPL